MVQYSCLLSFVRKNLWTAYATPILLCILGFHSLSILTCHFHSHLSQTVLQHMNQNIFQPLMGKFERKQLCAKHIFYLQRMKYYISITAYSFIMAYSCIVHSMTDIFYIHFQINTNMDRNGLYNSPSNENCYCAKPITT